MMFVKLVNIKWKCLFIAKFVFCNNPMPIVLGRWYLVTIFHFITIIFFYLLFIQVALKALVVIHRTLREGDPTFREELLNFQQRGRVLQLSNFKDDSSPIGMIYYLPQLFLFSFDIYLFFLIWLRLPLFYLQTLTCMWVLQFMFLLFFLQPGIALPGYALMHSFWKNDLNALGF